MLWVNQIVGFGVGALLPSTYAPTNAPGGDNDTGGSISQRVVCSGITGQFTQLRVTFMAGSTVGENVNNAAIGISAGSGATTAVPVELLFSAASGFALGAGASITSDWLTFAGFLSNGALVAILDHGTPSHTATSGSNTNCDSYFKAGATYTEASPSGLTSSAGNDLGGVVSIEFR